MISLFFFNTEALLCLDFLENKRISIQMKLSGSVMKEEQVGRAEM